MISIIEVTSLDEVNALMQLENHCFTSDRLTSKQLGHFITSSTAMILAAKKETIIASAVLLFRKRSQLARLYSIAVHPTHQQQGIAQRLLHALEANACKRRCTEIRLEVRPDNHAAIQLYHKNGYHSFGEYAHFYEDGALAWRMRKVITLTGGWYV